MDMNTLIIKIVAHLDKLELAFPIHISMREALKKAVEEIEAEFKAKEEPKAEAPVVEEVK